MPETKRCPNCGGLNPVAADWCGQCLQRFTPPPPPAPAVTAAVPPATPVAEMGDPETAEVVPHAAEEGGPPRATIGTSRGAFTVREQGIVWTCSRCGTENPLDNPMCSACGTPFAEVVQPKPEREQRDPGTAAIFSLLLPGAGHGYLGLWGQAIARAVLSVWVVFVVMVSLSEGRGTGARTVAILFGIAGTVLWVVAAHDAYREARDELGQVLLKGRGFLYVVGGLLVALLLLLTVTGLRTAG